jgi:DNA-binding response OmpR family regulator
LALLDVRLPDLEGTKLLTLLRETTPRMVKIIVTDFPILDNAVDAINRGVDSYLTKPLSKEKLLKTVREQLIKRDNENEFTEEKLKAYMASRFMHAKTIHRATAPIPVNSTRLQVNKNAKNTWQEYLLPRILVIDDDMSIRKTISMILEHAGYVVDTAENGEQAIIKSNSSFYNLALIDVLLPDMAGTKLLSLLKETVPKMRKVIITGYPALENAVESIDRGVDAYLTKPLNTQQLLDTIKQLLEKQSKDKESTEHKLVQYINSRMKAERTVQRGEEVQSFMKLKIGDCELPERCLLYVFLTVGSSLVSFAGVAYGEEGENIRKRLKLLSEQNAILYEAVGREGCTTAGLCCIRDLEFKELPTFPDRIEFSAQLVRPFIQG